MLLLLHPGSVAKYCDQRVCLSMYLSVCPFTCFKNRMSKLRGSVLLRRQCNMLGRPTFRFWDVCSRRQSTRPPRTLRRHCALFVAAADERVHQFAAARTEKSTGRRTHPLLRTVHRRHNFNCARGRSLLSMVALFYHVNEIDAVFVLKMHCLLPAVAANQRISLQLLCSVCLQPQAYIITDKNTAMLPHNTSWISKFDNSFLLMNDLLLTLN